MRMKEQFKIKDLGRAQHVLGMKITYEAGGCIQVDQEHYVKGLLKKYGMEDAKGFGTPMQSDIMLTKATEKEIEEFRETGYDYVAAIGSLNYLLQCTRPDIAFKVSIISQFLEKQSLGH
jgi:phage terminase large subunit